MRSLNHFQPGYLVDRLLYPESYEVDLGQTSWPRTNTAS